jgi:hypothetical protein
VSARAPKAMNPKRSVFCQVVACLMFWLLLTSSSCYAFETPASSRPLLLS